MKGGLSSALNAVKSGAKKVSETYNQNALAKNSFKTG